MATGHFRRSYMRMSVLYAKGDSDSDENGDRHDSSSYYSYASAVPVKGESFCDCPKGKELPCLCGEDDTIFDWTWDSNSKSAATYLSCNDREVKFHLDYSCGTAAVRGNKPMRNDQYFWEIKMTTPVYGTDMMVGVGTMHTNLDRFRYHFTSLLGRDCESWGLSYAGLIHHKGETRRYSGKFGQGSIIGVHLDMWRGTLAFYKNRRPLGVAYRGLQGKILFPMVSSTAARSGMKVIRSCSFPSSLQFLCCMSLRKSVPPNVNVLEALDTPPGLKTFLANNLDWLLSSWEPEQKNEKLSDWPQRKGRKRTRSESSDETEDLICCKKGCE